MSRRHPKKCPVLHFKVSRDRQYGTPIVEAFDQAGAPRASVHTGRSNDLYHVMLIRVDPKLRGCGVGTQLYTLLAQAACALGRPLASDYTRTYAAEMFWRKQVRKGRAQCVQKPGFRARRGVYHLVAGEETFHRTHSWPCSYYELACPVTSLAGGDY